MQTWVAWAGIEFAVLLFVTWYLLRHYAVRTISWLAWITVFISWCVPSGARCYVTLAGGSLPSPPRARLPLCAPTRPLSPLPRAPATTCLPLQVPGLLRDPIPAD